MFFSWAETFICESGPIALSLKLIYSGMNNIYSKLGFLQYC